MFAYCENNPISAVDPSGEMLITTAILIGAAILGGGAALYVGYKARKAGCGWGETVVRAAVSGISVFCSAYTLGMSAYGVYINYCTLNGKTPTTEIGAGTASSADIPKEAYDTYNYVTNHNGSPPKGYRGGREFLNDGRGGAEMLPGEYAPYREYDIYPKISGVDRGVERIVIGNGVDKPGWYTPDHYQTFIKMEIK